MDIIVIVNTKNCYNSECTQLNPQPISEFHKCKSRKDGLQNWCKTCSRSYKIGYTKENRAGIAIQSAIHYKENRERILAQQKSFYENNEEARKGRDDYRASYRFTHKEESAMYHLSYRIKNREKIAIQNAIYRKENSEKIAAYQIIYDAAHYAAHKEEELARHAVYAANNPGVIAAISAKRRAAKIKATPKWLTEEQKLQIRAIHVECARLTKELGVKHHVDHIVPLQGENVSGLHVPWNLQILTASANSSKGNKFPIP